MMISQKKSSSNEEPVMDGPPAIGFRQREKEHEPKTETNPHHCIRKINLVRLRLKLKENNKNRTEVSRQLEQISGLPSVINEVRNRNENIQTAQSNSLDVNLNFNEEFSGVI
ncbi:hypothetical protein DASC09_063530 [Saccharomycopsis crataegensis]|uniref:Uncharacterized protein n=1 Tax=Saccharomycopsis crataegensis TaxID=43959 RepID=A0AAV5QWU0_9ASCO|nr:hypothetical protein DASC09_063530 [Saccharomycopsis crataegensis]